MVEVEEYRVPLTRSRGAGMPGSNGGAPAALSPLTMERGVPPIAYAVHRRTCIEFFEKEAHARHASRSHQLPEYEQDFRLLAREWSCSITGPTSTRAVIARPTG